MKKIKLLPYLMIVSLITCFSLTSCENEDTCSIESERKDFTNALNKYQNNSTRDNCINLKNKGEIFIDAAEKCEADVSSTKIVITKLDCS
jgi:hypothetical protein